MLRRIEWRFDYTRPIVGGENHNQKLQVSRRWEPARCSAASVSVSIAAQTHFVVLVGFRVLPVIPIVQAKTALPGLGHGKIVLPAQTV
jgi:hypothetical protein